MSGVCARRRLRIACASSHHVLMPRASRVAVHLARYAREFAVVAMSCVVKIIMLPLFEITAAINALVQRLPHVLVQYS